MERQLNMAGVRMVDLPWIEIDWRTNEVVVAEPALDIDWMAFEQLRALAPGLVVDEPVLPGRYPLVGCAFVAPKRPSRAFAVALASRLVVNPAALGRQGTLDALRQVFLQTAPLSFEWSEPSKLVTSLVAMAHPTTEDEG